MELSILVYIWAGTLSLLLILLAIWVLVLNVMLSKLMNQVENGGNNTARPDDNGHNRFNPTPMARTIPSKPESVYSFGRPGILPDEELSQRGFQTHVPNPQRNYNPIKSQTTQAGIRGNQDYQTQLSPSYQKNSSRGEYGYPRNPSSNTRNDNFIY